MDSGNVKAPAGLHSLITGNRGERENQSGEQKSGEGGGFAGLIAAILANPKASKGQEGSASATAPAANGHAGTAANVSANAGATVQSGAAQSGAAQAAPLGANAFLLRVANDGAAAGKTPQGAQQVAGKAAASGRAGAGLEKLITTAPSGTGASASASATAAKVAQPASAAGAEGKAAANIATASTGEPVSPAGNHPSANAAAANAGHTGHTGQNSVGQGTAGLLREMTPAGAGVNDAGLVQAADSKASSAPQTAPAGVDAPVKGADASAAPKTAAQQGAGPQSIVQQVAQNLTVIAGNGVDRLRFQLHPAELGQVSVQLSIRAGATRVVIAAEHPAALEAMRHAAGSLQQALQNAGLNVEREGLQFDLQQHDQPQQQHADADVNGRKERGDADDRDGSRLVDDAGRQSSEPQQRPGGGLFI